MGEPVPAGMDQECVVLYHAMNRLPGIRTTESCCGHGEEAFMMLFTADRVESLAVLTSAIDFSHMISAPRPRGWSIKVIRGGWEPVLFILIGPVGDYAGANWIADLIAVETSGT